VKRTGLRAGHTRRKTEIRSQWNHHRRVADRHRFSKPPRLREGFVLDTSSSRTTIIDGRGAGTTSMSDGDPTRDPGCTVAGD
jgi:hypothetical protein